jgi:hypothetical protein
MMRARLRAGSGRLYSGYSSVMGFRKRCLKVVAKPLASAFIASKASFIDNVLPACVVGCSSSVVRGMPIALLAFLTPMAICQLQFQETYWINSLGRDIQNIQLNPQLNLNGQLTTDN